MLSNVSLVLLLLATLFALACALSLFATDCARKLTDDEKFEVYKKHFGKNYGEKTEHEKRKGEFKKALAKIRKHNAKTGKKFKLAVNEFSDKTPEELAHMSGRKARPKRNDSPPTTTKAPKKSAGRSKRFADWPCDPFTDDSCDPCQGDPDCEFSSYIEEPVTEEPTGTTSSSYYDYYNYYNDETTTEPETTTTTPKTTTRKATTGINWVTKGAVNAPTNQGDCGSCWAHATTGVLEGWYQIKYGTLPKLSRQQIVDCASTDTYSPNDGCDGGTVPTALEYVRDVSGVKTDSVYPYKTAQGTCRSPSGTKYAATVDVSTITYSTSSGKPMTWTQPYYEVQPYNATAFVNALKKGPIAISLYADFDEFYYYSEGVLDADACFDDEDADHAVLLVGYGTASDGTAYWLVKNSWGTTWGEAGYFRIVRDTRNACNIINEGFYPNLK